MEATEVLTFDEIKSRFAPIGAHRGPRDGRISKVLGGKVLFHSRNREEVYQKAIELKLDRFAFSYLGTYPEHWLPAL